MSPELPVKAQPARESLRDRKPIVLDLFCGAGGMSLGFEMAGYYIGLGVDKESLPCQTHAHNFGGRCVQRDIETITNPRTFIREHGLECVDVIIGGPPCQGYSRVGRGKIRNLKNDPTYIHDPRNQYYKEFIRFIEVLRPFYFVMENVPDMQYYTDGEGLVLEKALRRLSELGYTGGLNDRPFWNVFQADHYGVPQTRKRLFIVGNRLGIPVRWPRRTHLSQPVTVWEAIGDLPIIAHFCREDEMAYKPRQCTAYQCRMRQGMREHGLQGMLFNHQTRWHNQQDLHAFAWMPEGGKYIDLPKRFKRYRDDIFKDKYRKLCRDQPSWTIEAHIGKDTYRHIYPAGLGNIEPPRTISVREAARLQSFPDRFRFIGPFTKQFYQVGNAVPPLLAKAVARAILPDILVGMADLVGFGTTGLDSDDTRLFQVKRELVEVVL
jgi:DNA (cytosine-5)-methyltransferase 1